MARRSFVLQPLKWTSRPAFGAPSRKNLHQGLNTSGTSLDQTESSENIPNPNPSASVASRSADVLENEMQPVLEEPTMYSIESKSSTIGWAAIRKKMLSAVTEAEGMPTDQTCTLCQENYALIRCLQCGPQSYYCQTCMDSLHSRFSISHAAEKWMVSDYDLCCVV